MNIITKVNRDSSKIADLSDRIAIKNFILMDQEATPVGQTFEESFFFDGLVCVICLGGNAVFKVNHQEYVISKNSVLVLLSRQIFRLIDHSEDLVVETLFLSSDYILQLPIPRDLELLKAIGYKPTKNVDRDSIKDLLDLHSLIVKHHQKKDNPFCDLQVKGLVFAFMMELAGLYNVSRTFRPERMSRQEQLTDRFFTLLFENYKIERNVAFYAEQMCLTPKYLSMTVKKVTSRSILEWINEVAIIEAKRLLKMTDKTVLQISEELSFANPSFFGNFFRRHTGMTPIQYKKN